MDKTIIVKCREVMKQVNEEAQRRGATWRLVEVPGGVMKVEIDSATCPVLLETNN